MRVSRFALERVDLHKRGSFMRGLCSNCQAAALQVKQIPLVAFDVGGIYEMLDFDANAEAVVLEPTLKGLTAKLTGLNLPPLPTSFLCTTMPIIL